MNTRLCMGLARLSSSLSAHVQEAPYEEDASVCLRMEALRLHLPALRRVLLTGSLMTEGPMRFDGNRFWEAPKLEFLSVYSSGTVTF